MTAGLRLLPNWIQQKGWFDSGLEEGEAPPIRGVKEW
jgi:hypothetical protein